MSSTQQLSKFDIIAIITASISLVVVQSWNTVIKDALNYYIPDKHQSITAEVLYTLILTFFLAVVVYYMQNYSKPIQNIFNKIFK